MLSAARPIAPAPPRLAHALVACLTVIVARFALRAHLAVVAPEECLAGSFAASLLHGDLRAPLTAWTPALDEPGQLLVGLVATPAVALLGSTAFALKLTASLLSALRVGAAVFLTTRVLGERVPWRSRAFAALLGEAVALVAVFECALPGLYTFMAFALHGTHNAGATTDLVLLSVLARRVQSPTRRNALTLWALTGALVAWKVGSLLPASVALVGEALLRRTHPQHRAPWRAMLTAFALGLAPRLAWSLSLHGRDLHDLVARLTRLRPMDAWPELLVESWALVAGRHPLRALALAASLALVVPALRGWRTRPVRALVGLYASLVTAVCVLDRDGVFFCAYLLPPLTVLAVASLILAPRRVAPPRTAWHASLALGLSCAVMLQPDLRVDPDDLRALVRDPAGACVWQLGQSLATHGDPIDTTCRALGPVREPACVSGVGFAHRAIPEPTPALQRAWSFGVGRASMHGGDGCDRVRDELRASCRAGLAWECATYVDLLCRVDGAPVSHRVSDGPSLPGDGRRAPAVTRCALSDLAAPERCRGR